jgi:hypothetical protein
MSRKQTNGKAEEMPASRRAWLTQQFVEALAKDFEENGIAVIEKLRVQSPKDYAKLVSDLVPKVQTSDAADQFNFRSVDSLDQLVEKLARDISDWGMADRFIALLSKHNGDALAVG